MLSEARMRGSLITCRFFYAAWRWAFNVGHLINYLWMWCMFIVFAAGQDAGRLNVCWSRNNADVAVALELLFSITMKLWPNIKPSIKALESFWSERFRASSNGCVRVQSLTQLCKLGLACDISLRHSQEYLCYWAPCKQHTAQRKVRLTCPDPNPWILNYPRFKLSSQPSNSAFLVTSPRLFSRTF